MPCTTHRRTNNLLLLLTDRAESVNALAGYAKAFNLPQTETWVVPLLDERRRVLLNEEVSSTSSDDDDDDDDDDIDDLKNANSKNINDFSRRKRRRRLRRVVCDIALVARTRWTLIWSADSFFSLRKRSFTGVDGSVRDIRRVV